MQSKLAERNAEQQELLNEQKRLQQEKAELVRQRDLAAENERLRKQRDELQQQIAAAKAERKQVRRESTRIKKERGVELLDVCVCKDFDLPEKRDRRRARRRNRDEANEAPQFTIGQRAARVVLPIGWTLKFFVEQIRDGFLTDGESMERNKATEAAGYSGDSLFTQRGLPDPARRS